MRRLAGILWLLFWLPLPAAAWQAGSVQRLENASPVRVLFVGNSYLYYNDSLHNHVKRLLDELRPELQPDLEYKSATIGGARLGHHNIDWLLKPGRIGVDQPFQVVVMQGGSFEPLTAKARAAFLKTVVAYAKKVRRRGGEPALYMTHAYVPPHRRADPQLIERIAATYLEAGEAAQALVIPVGLAFHRSYQQRPGFMLHEDFDGTHPNLHGTYLAACVVYLSLYGGALQQAGYDYFGQLPAKDAAYLRQVAEATIHDFFKGRR